MKRLALLVLAACSGQSGTIKVSLATAPGSHVLDEVTKLRLTLTNPPQIVEATRGANGFDLAIELDAQGVAGALIVEGFDAGEGLVACGQSPPFPISAINSKIVIYMAPPRSIAAAPATLPSARSEVAGTLLSFGAFLAGGRDDAGAPADDVAIYDAYDHTLGTVMALPEARTGLAVATGINNGVYLFGGDSPANQATGTLWKFDLPSSVSPTGSYTPIADDPTLGRAYVRMLPVGVERFVIGGLPLLLELGTLMPRTDPLDLSNSAAVSVAGDTPIALFQGAQLIRFRDNTFDVLQNTERDGTGMVTLPDGRFLIVGGGDPPTRDALVVDGATGAITPIPNFLTTPRILPSVAATARHVVVAGGTPTPTGAPIATAEIFDASTLAPLATVPITPRTGMLALPLANDQVLLVGGSPASTLIELFTPEPPSH